MFVQFRVNISELILWYVTLIPYYKWSLRLRKIDALLLSGSAGLAYAKALGWLLKMCISDSATFLSCIIAGIVLSIYITSCNICYP